MPIDITLMAGNACNASPVIFKRVQQDHTLLGAKPRGYDGVFKDQRRGFVNPLRARRLAPYLPGFFCGGHPVF